MIPQSRHIFYGLGIFLLQWLVFGRIPLWGVIPDVTLLFVAFIGLRYGRLYGLLAGFGLGLLMDASFDTWGLHAFSKTLAGFFAGLVPSNDRETFIIQPSQAFLGGLLVALIQNGLIVLLTVLDAGMRTFFVLFGQWIGASLYTAVLALLAAQWFSR